MTAPRRLNCTATASIFCASNTGSGTATLRTIKDSIESMLVEERLLVRSPWHFDEHFEGAATEATKNIAIVAVQSPIRLDIAAADLLVSASASVVSAAASSIKALPAARNPLARSILSIAS